MPLTGAYPWRRRCGGLLIRCWGSDAPAARPPSKIGHHAADARVVPEVALRLTRRIVVRTGVLAALSPIFDRFGAPLLGASAYAQTRDGEGTAEWRHGLSLFGDLKY